MVKNKKQYLKKKISIIIPVFNQERNIIRNCYRLIMKLKKFVNINFEIIIVNDGSTDSTQQKLLYLINNFNNIKIINNKKNYGKGYSVKKAMLHTSPLSNKIIYIDSDLPYFNYFNKIIENLLKNNLVIINRKHKNSKLILKNFNMYILIRIFIGHVFNFFFRTLGLISVKDTQAGLKGFDAKFKYIFKYLKTNRFLFDLELMIIFKNQNIIPISIPCKYSISSSSSINLSFSFFISVFKDIVKIIFCNFKNNYKIN